MRNMRKRLRKKMDKQFVFESIDWWADDAVKKYVKGIEAIRALYDYSKPIRIINDK